MKKFCHLMLAALLLLSLAACGSGEAEKPEYTFPYKGETIAMHADFAPILRTLGDPITCTEETSCAFEGLDKTFYFGSFYVQTYPDRDTDRVLNLWFADDSVTTAEGIFIGAERKAAEAAYGPADSSGSWLLQQGSSELAILMDGDRVSSIQYRALFLP